MDALDVGFPGSVKSGRAPIGPSSAPSKAMTFRSRFACPQKARPEGEQKLVCNVRVLIYRVCVTDRPRFFEVSNRSVGVLTPWSDEALLQSKVMNPPSVGVKFSGRLTNERDRFKKLATRHWGEPSGETVCNWYFSVIEFKTTCR